MPLWARFGVSIQVCILAVGSAQGDDRLGWEVVEKIRCQHWPGVQARAVAAPSRLLDYLDDCQTLVVVDACRSGAAPGTMFRCAWPAPPVTTPGSPSSHGFDVVEALRLADTLGRLPPRVILVGMEVESCRPEEELSPAVRQALPQLMSLIRQEIDRLAAPEVRA